MHCCSVWEQGVESRCIQRRCLSCSSKLCAHLSLCGSSPSPYPAPPPPPPSPKLHFSPLPRPLPPPHAALLLSPFYPTPPLFSHSPTPHPPLGTRHLPRHAPRLANPSAPDLIVHCILDPTASNPVQTARESMKGLMERLHVLVIGPGLGRDDFMQSCAAEALQLAKERDMGVVIDADGLWLLNSKPELVRGWEGPARVVLTPNVMEFRRLCEAVVSPSASAGGARARRGEARRAPYNGDGFEEWRARDMWKRARLACPVDWGPESMSKESVRARTIWRTVLAPSGWALIARPSSTLVCSFIAPLLHP